MKKKIPLLTILASLTLVSCGGQTSESIPQSEPSNNLSSEISSDLVKEDLLIIADDQGKTDYKFVFGEVSDDMLYYLEEYIYKYIDEKQIDIVGSPTTSSIGEKEILLGLTNRQESVDLYNSIMPSTYAIKEVNGKIVVSAHDEAHLKKGLEKLYEVIEKNDGSNWSIEKGYAFYGDEFMNTYVPKLANTDGKFDGSYYCEDETLQIGYKDATLNDFNNYCTLLESNGYVKQFNNQIANSMFATYTNDVALVNVSYYPEKERVHVLYEPKGYLPTQQAFNNKVIDASFTQIGRRGSSQSSSGLSLTVQLEDGSYIMIDGGPVDASDEIKLLDFLKNNNPNGGKPKVKWMFTHAHHDHMNLAVSFLNKYYDEIDLEMFAFNFPDFDSLVITQEPVDRIEKSKSLIKEFYEVYNAHYKDVPIYKFHTGDKLQLAGCEIEFLITHETFWPNDFPWINHTSSAFTVTIDNKKMMVLGDCEQTECQWMEEVYKEELKSDILQVTHHGLNGGSLLMYQYVDPDICFWAIDKERYETSPWCLGQNGCDFNVWIRNDKIKDRDHYHASETTTLYVKDL